MKYSIKMTGGSREHLWTAALETAPSAFEMAKDHLEVKLSVYWALENGKFLSILVVCFISALICLLCTELDLSDINYCSRKSTEP